MEHGERPRQTIPEDSAQEEEDDGSDQNAVEPIKKAQQAVGEANWLVTRCRPDIMLTVSRMASYCTKDPAKTMRMPTHLWTYLADTYNEGLVFPRTEEMLQRLHGRIIRPWMCSSTVGGGANCMGQLQATDSCRPRGDHGRGSHARGSPGSH